MRSRTATENEFDRPMRIAGIVGIAAAVIAVIGLFIGGAEAFFQSYLFSYVFWLGISLGLLAILLLHFLMGTRWGLTVRRIAEAGAGSIWVMAILFIPLLLGMNYLFPWTRPAEVQASEILQAKTFYLNMPFFMIRQVVYFALWILMAFMVNRLAGQLGRSRETDVTLRGRLQGMGALYLIIYVLTMSFAAIDWLMSLQPFWNSSIFGLIIIVGQVLTGMGFALLVLNLFPGLSLGRRWSLDNTPMPYSDLGALLLTFVLGYAYLAYFQFLIIWAANIPRETVWYIDRSTGGWNIVIILVTLLQFVVPFAILLSFRVRHNLRVLAGVGALLLVSNLINLFWHVKPAFYPGAFAISWLDFVMPVALGGIWLAVFLYNLKRRPALSPADQAALELTQEARRAVS